MRQHRDLDRLLGDWLEDAPATAPDVVLSAILARLPSIAQRGSRRIAWWPTTSRRIARSTFVVASVVIVVFAVGGLLWLGASGAPFIGSPTQSGAPSPTFAPGGLVPDVVVGHWVAERDPDDLASGRYELIVEPDAASARWLDGTQPPVMLGEAGRGQRWEVIEFGPTTICEGSGSYFWHFSGDHPGDPILVVQPIEDACDARRSLLYGLWRALTRKDVPDLYPGDTEEWHDLGRGRQSLDVDGVPISFSVPAFVPDGGWARSGLYLHKHTAGGQAAEAVIYWTAFPGGTYADPCGALSPPIGPSIADLASTVSAAPDAELVSGPSDVTVGGLPAKHVVLTVMDDLSCDPGFFFTWVPPWGGPGWWGTDVGDTINVWIVDVDGTWLVIVGETEPDAGSALEREVQQIVDSIQFE